MLYLCGFVNPVEVVVWCVLAGAGAGKGVFETPDAVFVGPSVEALERLEVEGLGAVSCCRDCSFVCEVPVMGPACLLGVLLVRSVVLELVVLEKAA